MRLSTVRADLRNFTPHSGPYDLVVSHFFLDCLTEDETANLTTRIAPQLSPGAAWIVSEFAIPRMGVRRAVAHVLIRLLYAAFFCMTGLRVRKIPDYTQILNDCGFSRKRHVLLLGGLLSAELWIWKPLRRQ